MTHMINGITEMKALVGERPSSSLDTEITQARDLRLPRLIAN